jgi:hypothetical protein
MKWYTTTTSASLCQIRSVSIPSFLSSYSWKLHKWTLNLTSVTLTAVCPVSDSDSNVCATCLAYKMSHVKYWRMWGEGVQGSVCVQVLDELSLQESVQRAVSGTTTPDVLCLGPPGTVRFCQEPVPATARRYAAAMAGYTKLCSAHDATGRHA